MLELVHAVQEQYVRRRVDWIFGTRRAQEVHAVRLRLCRRLAISWRRRRAVGAVGEWLLLGHICL